MPDVTCQWIDDGHINHAVFHKASRLAVDEYVDWQKEHLALSIQDGFGLTLIDIRASGLPPVAHLARRSQWMREHYAIPPVSYTAVLHKNNIMLSLIESTLLMVRRDGHRDNLRLFTDEAAAWDWLRSQKAAR